MNPYEQDIHGALSAACATIPEFTPTDDTTPADLLLYWDDICTRGDEEQEKASLVVETLEAACKAAKGKERRAIQEKVELLLGVRDTIQTFGLDLMEDIKAAYTPRLKALLGESGLLPSEITPALDCFWACTERPQLDWAASWSLADLAKSYAAHVIGSEPATMLTRELRKLPQTVEQQLEITLS